MSDLSDLDASLFEGSDDFTPLRKGWSGLRTYGRRAKQAIIEGRTLEKIEHIHKAEQLLLVMQGILKPGDTSNLAESLRTIYIALHGCLLKANAQNSLDALNDWEAALGQLDRDFLPDLAKDAA